MEEYKEKFATLFKKRYGISFEELADSNTCSDSISQNSSYLVEEAYKNGETIEELANWLEEKYNLTDVTEF